MNILSWLSILTSTVLIIGLLLVFKATLHEKSSYLILLSLSMITLLGSNVVYLIDPSIGTVIKWLNLITLSCLQSSLFGLIRNSKPIFARFPAFLIYLPFIILLFFPLISHQNILTNLLLGTFQAGCIVVALMIYGIHQIKFGFTIWQLLGSIIFLIAFIIFWFVPLENSKALVITEVLVIAGIVAVTVGVNQTYQTKYNVK